MGAVTQTGDNFTDESHVCQRVTKVGAQDEGFVTSTRFLGPRPSSALGGLVRARFSGLRRFPSQKFSSKTTFIQNHYHPQTTFIPTLRGSAPTLRDPTLRCNTLRGNTLRGPTSGPHLSGFGLPPVGAPPPRQPPTRTTLSPGQPHPERPKVV